MEKRRGVSNINTLFGAHKTPSDNQIRNLLDTVAASYFTPVYRRIFTDLGKDGYFDSFKVLDKQWLLVFDGTEYFSSTLIHCECCSTTKQKDGKIRYYHNAVTPVIVSPNQSQVILLVPELLPRRMEITSKTVNSMRLNAGWIRGQSNSKNRTLPCWEMTCIAMNLFYQHILSKHWNFILVCKPDSHKTVYEHIDGLVRPRLR